MSRAPDHRPEFEATDAFEGRNLRQILDQSPAGVSIITRRRFERLFINPRMIELLGIAGREDTPGAETFVGRADYDWIMAKLAEGAMVDSVEFERRRVDDGRIWWSLLHARPTTFEGQEAGIIWLFDISGLKSIESKFRQLLVAQTDWFWEIDENLQIVNFSENFYVRSGLRPAEIEGLSMAEWGRRSHAAPQAYARFLDALRCRETVRNLEV